VNAHRLPAVLDPIAAREVADAHHDAPRTGGSGGDAAYAQLVDETERLFRLLTTGPTPVDIVFTLSERPYDDADELIRSVRRDRILEVTSATRDPDRPHPAMGCAVGGAYDRFRAVHDVLGHAYLGSASTATASTRRGGSRNGSTAPSPAERSPPSCTPSTACGGPPANCPSTRSPCSTSG
jgi:hypothetical protein